MQVQLKPVPGHPFVSYAVVPQRDVPARIWLHCSNCGRRVDAMPCNHPQQRAKTHVWNFAIEHGHGHSPVRR